MVSPRWRASMALAVLLLAVAGFDGPAQASGRGPTLAHSASAAVSSLRTFRAPAGVTHLAVHWRGARHARVRLALSRDGRRFTRAVPVELDDLFEAHPGRRPTARWSSLAACARR